MRKFAIIDCGTNTFNLLLAEAGKAAIRIVHEQKIPVKIGKGGIADGRITEEAAQRALEALKDYAEQIRRFGPDEIFAFATAAFRRARNGGQLKQEFFKETGITIHTISGEEEARLIANGVLHDYPVTGPVLIMDIGGGSTEFIISGPEGIMQSWSFELGASRLLEEFRPADPITPEEIEKIRAHFAGLLHPVVDAVHQSGASMLIGSSGFFDTLSEMAFYRFNLPDHPKNQVRYSVTAEQFLELYDMILPMPMEERLKVPGLAAFRADMIVVSFLQAGYILERTAIRKIVNTRFSLKEGILFQKWEEWKETL